MSDRRVMREWASLVRYERRQMNHAGWRLLSLEQEKDEADESSREWRIRLPAWEVEANAFLESFCVHYRNLQDFISPRASAQERDVTAGPFLGKPLNFSLVGRESAVISYRERLDKGLAHISKTRTTLLASEKVWPVSKMSREMDQAWQRFLDALRDEGYGDRIEWFSDETLAAHQLVPSGFSFPLSAAVTSSTHSIGPIASFTESPDFLIPPTTGRAVRDADKGED